MESAWLAKTPEHLQGQRHGWRRWVWYPSASTQFKSGGLGFVPLARSCPWLLLKGCEQHCWSLQLEWKLEMPNQTQLGCW